LAYRTVSRIETHRGPSSCLYVQSFSETRFWPRCALLLEGIGVNFLRCCPQLNDCVVQEIVGRKAASTRDGSCAVPVGESPAGLFENRQQRAGVPLVKNRIHHDLRASSGHKHVAIAVAPGALESYRASQALVSDIRTCCNKPCEICCHERSLCQAS